MPNDSEERAWQFSQAPEVRETMSTLVEVGYHAIQKRILWERRLRYLSEQIQNGADRGQAHKDEASSANR
jgi:hypothetical protein